MDVMILVIKTIHHSLHMLRSNYMTLFYGPMGLTNVSIMKMIDC